jgi:hypothetical protein
MGRLAQIFRNFFKGIWESAGAGYRAEVNLGVRKMKAERDMYDRYRPNYREGAEGLGIRKMRAERDMYGLYE